VTGLPEWSPATAGRNRLPAMGLWARRLLALVAVSAAVLLGPLADARAETTTPTPPASASATPSPSATPEGENADAPDVPLDETRTILVLVGAGMLALIAGAVVFLRR